ncbi:MAG: 1-phosphofructokinase family hexose kinase [Acidimicrobiia bacterium]
MSDDVQQQQQPSDRADEVTGSLCIFAPAPQLTITIEKTVDDRAELHVHAGGQGVWVARMVRTLGVQPILCSPFGGETGALVQELALGEGFEVRGVETAGANSAYIDDRRGAERSVLVEIPAAVLSRHELDDLYARTLETAVASGVCVITGTHADRIIPDETFRRLGADLRANDIVVVADLSEEPLDALMQSGIDLLKISHVELEAAGLADGGDESIRRAIERLRAGGVVDVVVSRAEHPSIAAIGDELYEVTSPQLEVVEARGSGDSMTAGLAVAALRGLGPIDMLTLAAAAGSSGVTRHGVATGGRQMVETLREKVEVRSVNDVRRPDDTAVRSRS